MKRSFNPWLLVMLLILGIFVFNQFNSTGANREITFSTFTSLVEQGTVAAVVVDRNTGNITGELSSETQVTIDGAPQTIRTFRTTAILTDTLLEDLRGNVEQVTIRNPPQWIGILLGSILPIAILLGFFWFVFMRAQGGPNQVMQFGQSRARTFGRENKVNTTFGDVAGHKEAKQELVEVVDFLKSPQKYLRIGAEIPKGVLLVGPPGTGKTLLARAVAGEAGVPFLTVSASEFMEMFVGVGASRVRSLFEEARKAAPAIIFIDELDSIGRRRGAGIGGGHDEREQTLNQILSEMDGFEKDTSVIIIAATNRPDILDPALLRPGRFDRQVTIGLPTQRERAEILKVHVRNKPIAEDVSLERLSEATPMFSGADLENLTNEAALIAARTSKQIINWNDFNEALDRITLGLRRGSLVPTEVERSVLAYHESGHAVAYAAQPELGEIRKVTIMPRGGAGGFMAPLSREEMFYNVDRYRSQLIVAFGGRIAEKRITGTISSGASNDLKQATDLAKQMVLDMGMGSDEFVAWGSDQGPIFLGGEISRRKDFSEETARELEEQVSTILESTYAECAQLIEKNWTAVDAVAKALLQRETLDGKLIKKGVAMATEGAAVDEIVDWIIDSSVEAERKLQETEERERKAAEAERRRKANEAGRITGGHGIDPRPAQEPGA
ncbi:MAG TPA: ATP-dependent zinc metalloprotease FtsH [Trueperaceae bacterium]|nr:ATP-dependent zinc metalloprotease FtsH [Trueperaceae bacterium]